MNDFISRQALIAEFKEKCNGECGCCEYNDSNFDTAEKCRLIHEAPAADVQPVQRGRWFLRGGNWCCSACNKKTLLTLESNIGGCKEYGTVKTDYCPNCGAKMESEDK